MNVFSKLFKKSKCEHEYKYFDTEYYVYNSYTKVFETRFLFICSKCEKIICVSDSELFDTFDKFERDYKIANALRKPIEFVPEDLILKHKKGTIEFSGVPCSMMLDAYKKRGINLKDIKNV